MFLGPTLHESKDNLEDHLHRKRALHATIKKDLHKAKLELLKYEQMTAKNEFVPGILDIHKATVSSLEDDLADSLAKMEQWKAKISEVEAKMAPTPAAGPAKSKSDDEPTLDDMEDLLDAATRKEGES